VGKVPEKGSELSDYTMKQQGDGTWHAWPHDGGPLRGAAGKGWDLVKEIKSEDGTVHWEGPDDIARFSEEYGPAPAEDGAS
jgi:hypothetical protein